MSPERPSIRTRNIVPEAKIGLERSSPIVPEIVPGTFHRSNRTQPIVFKWFSVERRTEEKGVFRPSLPTVPFRTFPIGGTLERYQC